MRGGRFRGSLAGLFGLPGLSRLFGSLNQTNQTNQTDQMNQIPATRRKIQNVPIFLPLTLILLLVQNFTNSLQAGKMGAYLQASTYVSPTLLLTFLFPRRDHENPQPTAHHSANGRSKNARCPQEKWRTIHGRHQRTDGDRLGAGVHVSGPSQPDWKGLADSRSPL